MKKTIPLIVVLSILLIPTLFAININVEKISKDSTIIIGHEKPATFEIEITNNGPNENLTFYNFYTQEFFPEESIPILQGETKRVTIKAYLPEDVKTTGHRTFEYFIRGEDKTKVSESLTINAVELKDAFEVGSGEIDSESETMSVYVHNRLNFNFENLNVKFSSPFFESNEAFSLEPYQRKEFTVNIEKENFKKLMAGFYTMEVDFQFENLDAKLETPIKYVEKNILTESKKDYGFLINTRIISRTNEGNVVAPAETTIEKNIFSRLFTTFNPKPDYVERNGSKIFYTWNEEINPGENSEIKVTTNWLFPVLVIVLILVIVFLTKYFSTRNLVLRKKVSFVKAKGGEFALKVTIVAKAKKYIERVNITERLPPLTKIHERFGTEKPKRVDEKNKKIEWSFDKLEEGETRVMSYVLYSKVGVVGKFALPRASALFERDGKILERNSNKAFFVIEQNSPTREE